MTRKLVFNMRTLLLFLHVLGGGFFLTLLFASSSTLAQGQLSSRCSRDSQCQTGLYCFACRAAGSAFFASYCTRSDATPTSAFPKNTSLPFNKYAWLTTHNSFAIFGSPPRAGTPIITFFNQEDSVTQQLNNGVRGLMLDMYDFKNTVWLCHSFNGKCFDFTAFRPAIETLIEIKSFLDNNAMEIITIFIEDYVNAPFGLTKVFTSAGLMKYWFPLSNMPVGGADWPTLDTMIQMNHRLIVFTSMDKEATEGIAHQWNFTNENQFGDDGMKQGICINRGGSSVMSDTTKALIVQNFFPTNPNPIEVCVDNSDALWNELSSCYSASGNRWSNFLAVDFYKRSTGGGAFHAVDTLNGQLECGCLDITSHCSCSSLETREG
ncbi:unnamed protein product [Sphagnum compactum]